MMERGASLSEQFMSPQERFKKQMAELEQLRGVGAIGQGAFERAQAAYQQQMGQTGPQLGTPGTIQGTAAGSVAASARLAEHRAQFAGEEKRKTEIDFLAQISAASNETVDLIGQMLKAYEDDDTI
jgi:hypothetical protein